MSARRPVAQAPTPKQLEALREIAAGRRVHAVILAALYSHDWIRDPGPALTELGREWLDGRRDAIAPATLARIDAEIVRNEMPRAVLRARFGLSDRWIRARALELGVDIAGRRGRELAFGPPIGGAT